MRQRLGAGVRMYSCGLHLVERPLALVRLLSPEQSLTKSTGGEALGDVGCDSALLGAAEVRVDFHQVHGAEAVRLGEDLADVGRLTEGKAANLGVIRQSLVLGRRGSSLVRGV